MMMTAMAMVYYDDEMSMVNYDDMMMMTMAMSMVNYARLYDEDVNGKL